MNPSDVIQRAQEAAEAHMAEVLGWDHLAESSDAGRASDAAIRSVLTELRAAWLIHNDKMLALMDSILGELDSKETE